MRNHYALLSAFLFLLFPLSGRAQEQAQQARFKLGASLNTGLSYTGLSFTTGLSARLRAVELIAGPKILLSDTYRLSAGPWGLASSLYFYPAASSQKRLQSFANLDYQLIIRQPYCPTGNCNFARNDLTHEASFGYGISYSLTKQMHVFNAINLGLYQEQLYTRDATTRLKIKGFNALIKLGLTYHFYEK